MNWVCSDFVQNVVKNDYLQNAELYLHLVKLIK